MTDGDRYRLGPAGVGNRQARAEHDGRKAEQIAAAYLRLKGYRIEAMRYRTPAGEIDIVARTDYLVAFVEVKARPTVAEGLEAVTPRSQGRIARAADCFLAKTAEAADLDLRFDVIVITPDQWPYHMADAWRVDC